MGHAVMDEVDLLDRHLERPRAARAGDAVLAHLALLPDPERELHFVAAAAGWIARIEHPAEPGLVLAQREQLGHVAAAEALVDLYPFPLDRAADALVASRAKLQ